MGALPLLMGLGGGSGGCLVPCEPEVGVRDNGWVEAPAEDTERTGFPDGEENWLPGWLDGVRGDDLAPGSGPDVISHLGGMTVCLGGRGSRRVSLRESGSGTKWLSDSVSEKNKQKNHDGM